MTIMKLPRWRSRFTRKRPTPGMRPRGVVVLKFVDARAVAVRDDELQRDRARLLGREPLLGERHELAIDAAAEHVTGLDVQVALRRVRWRTR